jgi:NitT/TauT family transport system permease protein
MNTDRPTILGQQVAAPRRFARTASALQIVLPVISLAALILVWAAAVPLFDIPKYVIPSPASVLRTMNEERSQLISDASATGTVAVLGLIVSVGVAIPLGLLIGMWRRARRFLMPPLVALQSLPKVALAPLFVAWLGFGIAPKLIITVLITFFPMTLATIVGVQSVTITTVRMAHSMGCRGGKFVRFVVLPSAAPFVSAAFRTSATLAVVGTLVAEFVGSANGLGNLLLIASAERNTTLAFGAILTVAILGIAFYIVAAVAARLATRGLGSAHMGSVT